MEEINESSSSECPICLQPLLYPVKLPCSHQFCYLCVKGLRDPAVLKRCAMCRQQFSLEQIEQTLELSKDFSLTKFIWFYESRGGDSWWAFDEKSSEEIEKAFSSSKTDIAITIAGYTYIVDFLKMQQYRSDTPTRVRKIKRQQDENSTNFKIKGIAGLRVASSATATSSAAQVPQIDLTCDENDDLTQTLSDIVLLDDDDVTS